MSKQYTEQEESEIVEVFMLNEDDRDERLKAHYRQGKIVFGKWVNAVDEEELFTDKYCEWLRLKNIDCGDDETLREYKRELAGFGTQYHDGTGFADCDEDNTGWRKCKDEPNKNKWCSECVYKELAGI